MLGLNIRGRVLERHGNANIDRPFEGLEFPVRPMKSPIAVLRKAGIFALS